MVVTNKTKKRAGNEEMDVKSVGEVRALSRRQLLKIGLTVGARLVVGGGFITSSTALWAVEVKTLKPHTMATLIQMARDIYPHDSFGDDIYASALKDYDSNAGKDPKLKKLIEEGVATLDKMATESGHENYLSIGWEKDRVAILTSVEKSAFFQMIRGGLVVGIYNRKDVWEILGYEGESYSKSGYLDRGFDDINWL